MQKLIMMNDQLNINQDVLISALDILLLYVTEYKAALDKIGRNSQTSFPILDMGQLSKDLNDAMNQLETSITNLDNARIYNYKK